MPNPPFPDAADAAPLIWNLQAFSGINTQASRPAIGDQEFSWLQNYMPIGNGNMRTLYSNGTAVYTAPGGKTIIYYYFFNLATVQQCAVFLSDGTAVQVNPITMATVTISSTAGDFYAGGYLPAAAQWNAAGIIIVTEATNPNGYFAWDGSTLFRPGQNAPNWLTDTTPTVMPSGIHGNAVETYQNRAWVTTPNEAGSIPSIISQSEGGNGANFNTNAGGGSTPQQDSSLRATFTALKQTNGFLYYTGDSSVGAISNPQTTGGVTTYSNLNVDPQRGTSWPGTLQQFTTSLGPGLMFANPQGVFVLVGGSVQKVSGDLDGLFNSADFGTVTPTGATAIIFGITVYVFIFKTVDFNGNNVIVMAMTDGRGNARGDGFRWWLASQDASVTQIRPAELNSNLQVWGCDGTTLFQCFTTPSATLAKTYQTKFYPGQSAAEYIIYKKMYRLYYIAKDNSGSGVAFNGTIDGANSSTAITPTASGIGQLLFVNNSNQIIQFVNNSSVLIIFSLSNVLIFYHDFAAYDLLLGLTLKSTNTDFSMIAITMLYANDAPLGG